jgi:hypothetical protein
MSAKKVGRVDLIETSGFLQPSAPLFATITLFYNLLDAFGPNLVLDPHKRQALCCSA